MHEGNGATLYLLVGYPGSGKTTTALALHKLTGALHIWADKERQAMFNTPSHSYSESQKLYTYLNQKVSECLQNGQSVIFDTNFNYKKDRSYLRMLARRANAKVIIIWLTTPEELAKRRATLESQGQPTRVYGNMAPEIFEAIAGRLEAPGGDEQPIIILDGTQITPNCIADRLGLQDEERGEPRR